MLRYEAVGRVCISLNASPSYAKARRFVSSCLVILNHMVQYSQQLDTAFAALSDPTRRGVLEQLGRQDASISDLATAFGMSLTGMKKHVAILERAGMVTTEKVGRVRVCKLGPRRLDDESTWIASYRRMLEEQLDRLGDFLEQQKGSQ